MTVHGRLVVPTGHAIEVDRTVGRDATVAMANQTFAVAHDHVGRRITLRLDGHLMHAIADEQVIATWTCPLAPTELGGVRGARLTDNLLPRTVQPRSATIERRVPADGVTMVAGQRLRIGRIHAEKIVTIVVEDTYFRVLHDGEELAVHQRDPRRRPIRVTAYSRRNP